MNFIAKAEETSNSLNNMLNEARARGEVISDDLSFELCYNVSTMRNKLLLWRDTGMKSFMLSKELIEAFSHTDIPYDLCPNDFKYPFEAFMVESEFPLFETHIPVEESLKPVYGILFLNSDVLMKSGARLVNFDGTPADKIDWKISLTAFYPGSNAGVENLMMYIRGNESFIECSKTKKPGRLLFGLEESDARNIVNIFFNSVLYINDPSRRSNETEEHRERNFKDKKTKKFYHSKYIYLKAPRSYKSFSTGTSRKIDKRFIVRGHWRNQAHGKNMSERKMIWIMPHYRGNLFQRETLKKYKVN